MEVTRPNDGKTIFSRRRRWLLPKSDARSGGLLLDEDEHLHGSRGNSSDD
jgi:hypothetical protein